MVPKPYFFGFFIFAWAVMTWVAIAWAEMKENFFLHILIIMWVFKLVCKFVKIEFEDFA